MSQHNILEALNVRVVGTGDRILFLAHGFGTDQSAWHLILPYFTQTYRVVLYDLVCAGSVNPDYFNFDRYTTLDPYVDDLLNIVDSLGIQNCAYVGHSVSAMIGIIASIRRPELFSKLILIGFSPRFLNDEDYHGGFEQGEIEKVFSAMEANYEAWVHGFAPLAVGADVPAAVREFSRTLFNMRPDISLFVSRTVFNSDLRGVLGLVRVPACVIQTAKDVSVPASVAEYLRAHLGGDTTVETLKTEGHLPHLSAPAQLAQFLRRALPRVNTRGAFLCAREAANRIKRGGGGRIILLSTSLVQSLHPYYGSYTASKAAVEAMAKILAKELKGTEITVNCVSPGAVATDMFFTGLSNEIVEEVKSYNLFGRLGETKDIAPVVGFLASDAGEWINGQVIIANGGSLL